MAAYGHGESSTRPGVGAVARIDLRDPVPAGLADEVSRRILFASAGIVHFELNIDDDAVVGITVYGKQELDAEELARKLNAMVDSDVRPQLVTPAKVVWTSPVPPKLIEGAFGRLAQAGAVAESGEGQVTLSEPLLGLLDYFDRTLLGLLTSSFQVRQYRYPTLIRTEILERAGYIKAFPHHLMLVTRLHNDFDVYQAFLDDHGGDAEPLLAYCRNADYCLPPTMCYHTFEQHRGRTLGRDGICVVTACGKSFRYEAGYAATLERLWDFTIREMVFMGTRDEVLAARQLIMSKTFALMEQFGMSGFCQVANDPFFGGSAADRVLSQRMLELKYELRLPVDGARSIAVASFNFHNDLFGQSFGIEHNEGGPIWSGCVGFGLERLVYAFLCQFGLAPESWPAAVRAGLS